MHFDGDVEACFKHTVMCRSSKENASLRTYYKTSLCFYFCDTHSLHIYAYFLKVGGVA